MSDPLRNEMQLISEDDLNDLISSCEFEDEAPFSPCQEKLILNALRELRILRSQSKACQCVYCRRSENCIYE